MKIVLTIIQLTIGPSKNFLSHIGTPYISSCMAYAIWELVPTWLKVLTWSGTQVISPLVLSASIWERGHFVFPLLITESQKNIQANPCGFIRDNKKAPAIKQI